MTPAFLHFLLAAVVLDVTAVAHRQAVQYPPLEKESVTSPDSTVKGVGTGANITMAAVRRDDESWACYVDNGCDVRAFSNGLAEMQSRKKTDGKRLLILVYGLLRTFKEVWPLWEKQFQLKNFQAAGGKVDVMLLTSLTVFESGKDIQFKRHYPKVTSQDIKNFYGDNLIGMVASDDPQDFGISRVYRFVTRSQTLLNEYDRILGIRPDIVLSFKERERKSVNIDDLCEGDNKGGHFIIKGNYPIGCSWCDSDYDKAFLSCDPKAAFMFGSGMLRDGTCRKPNGELPKIHPSIKGNAGSWNAPCPTPDGTGFGKPSSDRGECRAAYDFEMDGRKLGALEGNTNAISLHQKMTPAFLHFLFAASVLPDVTAVAHRQAVQYPPLEKMSVTSPDVTVTGAGTAANITMAREDQSWACYVDKGCDIIKFSSNLAQTQPRKETDGKSLLVLVFGLLRTFREVWPLWEKQFQLNEFQAAGGKVDVMLLTSLTVFESGRDLDLKRFYKKVTTKDLRDFYGEKLIGVVASDDSRDFGIDRVYRFINRSQTLLNKYDRILGMRPDVVLKFDEANKKSVNIDDLCKGDNKGGYFIIKGDYHIRCTWCENDWDKAFLSCDPKAAFMFGSGMLRSGTCRKPNGELPKIHPSIKGKTGAWDVPCPGEKPSSDRGECRAAYDFEMDGRMLGALEGIYSTFSTNR
ncbi:hypothetical protein AAMO2058_001206900 [Amorphochlora amoebiformis]